MFRTACGSCSAGVCSRLPGETLDVLLEVAALARPTVEVVAAAHGDRERVMRGLDAAVREGAVTLDGSRVRFTHPLLASICYEEAPCGSVAPSTGLWPVRSRTSRKGPATWRWLPKGPDAAVAEELDGAAEQAAARGGTAAAAELCELAAELTPEDPRPGAGAALRGGDLPSSRR